MKLRSYTALCVAIVATLTRCSDDDVEPRIYMPSAKSVISANFDISDTVTYTATIVGADYPTISASAGNDVTVNFKVDEEKVSSFNQAMGTNYTILPAANFTFESTAIISKGTNTTSPLKLIIKKGEDFDAFTSFLLPIAIDQVSGGSVGDMQQTTYFVLTRSPALGNIPLYDKSLWSIAGMSTEEPGEGSGNGLAIAAIDNNWGTFWHSKWAGGEPAPPHHVTINLGEEKIVHGISVVARDLKDWPHGQPSGIKVAISTNGVDFVDNGTFPSVPMNTDPKQSESRFFLTSFKTAKFIRVTVTSTWGGTNSTSVAEIGAF
ncbi:MAG: DUF1735 domain-containing protein [Chryseolinea sp.]